MEKPILIIDPGHGGKDPGGGSNGLWTEKEFVLKISLYQLSRFQELGIPAAITRTEDIYLDQQQRTTIVRTSGAAYCISNHINAGGGEGAETIHSIYSDGRLSLKILEELEKSGQIIRRAYTRRSTTNSQEDYYYMHRQTGSVETVIIEYGFADNQGDIERLLQHWQAYAEAVVKAFCEHMGYAYRASSIGLSEPWKYEGVDYLHQEGILLDPEVWKEKINEPMPVWAVTLLLRKVHEGLKN